MNTETILTFADLIDTCQGFDQLKSDSVVSAGEFSFADSGQINLPAGLGTMQLTMEDLALNQLAGRLGGTYWQQPKRVIPSDFYRQLCRQWPAHFASLTNEMLDRQGGKYLVRCYDDRVRAVLSDQYAKLDNADVLDMAGTLLDGSGIDYEIVQSGKYYSRNDGVQRDEMAVRVIVKNVQPPDEPGSYGIGVLIRNGETGGSASEVRPLIMRTSCMNSLVFKTGEDGEKLGLRLTHRGVKAAKVNLLASAIAEALPMAEEGLAKFLALKTQEVDLAGVIGKLGEQYGWGEEMKLTISVGTEGRNSLFGLVNGLTYAAHEIECDQSARLDLESMAGVIVHNPQTITRLL